LVKAYVAPLDMVLRHPILVFTACAVIIVAAWQVHGGLREELVPEEDRGKVSVRLTGPDGVGLTYTDRQVEAVEKILQPFLDQGVAKNLYTITGRYDLNRGQVDARLVDWSARTLTESEIANAVNRQLSGIPGAQARVLRGNSLNLRNADGGLDFALIGTNYQEIFAQTSRFTLAMEERLPWLSNTRVEFRATQPELSININRERATDLGVDIGDLATIIQVLIDEFEVSELTVDDLSIPIMLQANEGAIKEPDDIANLYVPAAGGRLVPLSQLVFFSESSVAAELDRHEQRRAIEVSADIAPERTLREAVDSVRALAREVLPPDTGLIFLGEAKALNETSSDLAVTYVIAFVVVFLVLVAQFESITSALVVIITVPFGVCAAIFALYLSGTSVNIYSQIGVLLLIGIMAKNAILMVEFADQCREDGMSPIQAARHASLVRLRPIMMTMISTVFAGLPLIFGTGAGAESRTSIGWVIFGGLGIAGFVTLFLAPVLYSRIAGFSKPRSQAGAELQDELHHAEGHNLREATGGKEVPAE